MLEVRLAGGLQLCADGVELAPPTSKRARAVLAFLALNPGAHPRGRLAARFWPDVLDESARASLRVALTELRQALGPEAVHLVATRDTVALETPASLAMSRMSMACFRSAVPAGIPGKGFLAVDLYVYHSSLESAVTAADPRGRSFCERGAGNLFILSQR